MDRKLYEEYRFKYNNAAKLNHSVPIDVSLELSSYCNQRCGYCYHSDQKNLPFKLGVMSYSLAKRILYQSAELGVHSLKFNQKGEATLNPHFSQITAVAKSLAHDGVFIDRITNSNFKFATNNELIFEGLLNQTKVKVSFDSFNPEIMETQRAGSVHSITMENIDKFYNHPKRKETELVIQAVRTKLNKDEDIEGEVKKRWPSALVSVRDMVGGRVNSDVSALENLSRENRKRQTCIQAHARLIINFEGKVMMCCPDIKEELCLGDANYQTLFWLFNSPKAVQIRKDLLSGSAFTLEPCKSCSSHESYEGYSHSKDS